MSLASSSCEGLVMWLTLDSKKFEFCDSKTRFYKQIQFYSYKMLLWGRFRPLIFFKKCFENGLISCKMCFETQGTPPDRFHAFWEYLECFWENRKFQVEMRFLRLILIFSTQMSWCAYLAGLNSYLLPHWLVVYGHIRSENSLWVLKTSFWDNFFIQGAKVI